MATSLIITPEFTTTQNTRAASFRQAKAEVEAKIAAINAELDAIPALVERTRVATAYCEAAVGGATTPTPSTGFVPKGVVAEGDSTTSGGGSNTLAWPAQYATLTGIPVVNIATSGDSIDNMRDQYDAGAGTMYNASTRDTFILNGGKNDIANNGASDTYVRGIIQLIAGKARTTGYKVFISTLTPRVVDATWTQTKENYRLALNTWLRANYASFSDGLIDIDAAITTADYWDGLHPTNAGAAKIAAKVKSTFDNSGTAVVPGVVDDITTNGVIDAAKYRSIDLSSATGIAYRYGTASAAISGLPTWYKPADKFMPVGDVRGYQLGTYTTDAGDFASNVLHIGWTPDDPVARIGVSDIQATSNGHRVVSLKPELSWTRYGGGLDGTEPKYWKDQGKRVRNPVAMGHALGRSGWAVETFCGFDDGFICTVGANTMTNKSFCQLATGKKITGIGVTSSNEFMLVTVWDTINLRGEVAVISLCGLGDGKTIADPVFPSANGNEGWWGEWNTPHPGMHNLGNIAFMKVLGYVPLTGMMAPTEISATTGHHRYRYLNGSGANETCGNTGNWTADEAQRQRWAVGDYSDRYAKQGMAVIISKTESKAIFLDLNPLFTYMNSMYFGTRANYLLTTNIGQGAGQWPYTFAEQPSQMPVIAKTVTLPSKPTSCLIYQYTFGSTPHRAWIGTEDGNLRIFDLGGYPQSGTPSQIVQLATVAVGANPTSIAPIKEKAQPTDPTIVNDVSQTLVVGVRSTKAAVFVDLTNGGNSGVVKRTFQDSRVQDLIRVEDHDNHGTLQFSCSIADHLGKCVHNFRYGKIIMTTYTGTPTFGMGATGTDQFEYNGSFSVPGRPFWVGTANIS